MSHQLCVAHVRKYVKRRSKSILEQAERERKAKREEPPRRNRANLKPIWRA